MGPLEENKIALRMSQLKYNQRLGNPKWELYTPLDTYRRPFLCPEMHHSNNFYFQWLLSRTKQHNDNSQWYHVYSWNRTDCQKIISFCCRTGNTLLRTIFSNNLEKVTSINWFLRACNILWRSKFSRHNYWNGNNTIKNLNKLICSSIKIQTEPCMETQIVFFSFTRLTNTNIWSHIKCIIYSWQTLEFGYYYRLAAYGFILIANV